MALTALGESIRQRFDVHESTVLAIPETALDSGTSQDRYRRWRRSLPQDRRNLVEYVVPRINRSIDRGDARFMARSGGHADLDADALAAAVIELGPWRIPFDLRGGLNTMPESLVANVTRGRVLYRRDLIIGTLVDLLGDDIRNVSVLDIGCNSGFFSLEAAAAGVGRVQGFDLREENIAQARFLAEHYEMDGVSFDVAHAGTWSTHEQFDVVLNLGVLYHVTDPLRFIRQTYEACRRFAIIDTLCSLEPFSGFVLLGDKDVSRSTEGSETVELHPTYRGAVDTIRYAGFSEIVEVVGLAEPPHPLYAEGRRRCFIAIK